MHSGCTVYTFLVIGLVFLPLVELNAAPLVNFACVSSDPVLVKANDQGASGYRFWGHIPGKGLSTIGTEGVERSYGFSDGCRFSSVLRIVSDPFGTFVLGNNQNLQFISARTGALSKVLLSGVQDFHLWNDHCFVVRENVLLCAPYPELKSFSELFRFQGAGELIGGAEGPLFLKVKNAIYTIQKEEIPRVFSVRKSEFLSRTQILQCVYNGRTGLINHGFGCFSICRDGEWAEISVRDYTTDPVDELVLEGEELFVLSQGRLFHLANPRHLAQSLLKGAVEFVLPSASPHSPLSQRVTALAAIDDMYWVGTSTGTILRYSTSGQFLSKVPLAVNLQGKAVKSIVRSGKYIGFTADRGVYSHNLESGQFSGVRSTLPMQTIQAIEPLSFMKVVLSGSRGLGTLDIPSGQWTDIYIEEPVAFLSKDVNTGISIVNNDRFSRWNIHSGRLARRIRLGEKRITHCSFFRNLFYYNSGTRVCRVSTKNTGVPSVLWSVAPVMYHSVSGRAIREQITAMTVDAYGVVVGLDTGEVKRVSRFQRRAGRNSFGVFSKGRSFATSLTNRGNTLFAAVKGDNGGLYSTAAHINHQSSKADTTWKKLLSFKDIGVLSLYSLVFSGDWLAGRAKGKVVLYNTVSGENIVLDGSYGSLSSGVRSLASYGKTLYIGGQGLSVVKPDEFFKVVR